MVVSGLACNPSRVFCCLVPTRGPTLRPGLVSPFPCNKSFIGKMQFLSYTDRQCCILGSSFERTGKAKSGIYASFGDMDDDSTAVFPRIHVKDPFKRLGISKEASEDEIQAARNFLINKYTGHKPSVDSIESAHDKIIMRKFYQRKNPKIDLKKKAREVTQSRIVKAVVSRFETPRMNVIIKTACSFVALGILTVLFPTEEGPTLQVAISLIISIYFIYERLRSRIRALLYGVGAFFGSWLLATFLMVSVIPPLLRGPRSFEVTTSLITYLLLWVSSTYLK